MKLLQLWGETIAGIFATAPRQHWDILKRDVAYTLRMMRKNAGFTVLAVVTLALGIGANTAIFSVVQSVLLRPLPYAEGQQLVVLTQQAKKSGLEDIKFSVHEIEDYRQQSRTLAAVAEHHAMSFILYGHGDPDRVRSAVVSANYFDLFAVTPLLGRTFVPGDDAPGAPPVLILSNQYWKTKFGADPGIVGKVFEMNDKPHTVVGVLPSLPQYPSESDVYMPTSACPFRSSESFISNRDARMMTVFARLHSGFTASQAAADVATISSRLRAAYPRSYPETMGYAAETSPLQEELTRHARPTLLVLLAAAGFVLLIACANVANLMLARMSRRERELAVRTALGAGRGRLLRQLLTESFVLALMAGTLGLLFAFNSLHLLTDFAARLTPRAHEIKIDGPVLGFALLAAFVTSIVFGTLSALAARANLSSSLKEGTPGAGTTRQAGTVRNVLIVGQVAFSFMLLAGAGLMLRSLLQILQVDPGFAPQHVLAMRTTFNSSGPRREFVAVINKTLAQVQAQPGVQSAAFSSIYPLEPEVVAQGAQGMAAEFQVEGRELAAGEAPPAGSFTVVSPDYFRTLGIPLKEGRMFTERDGAWWQVSSSPEGALAKGFSAVAMINQAMKHRLFPNESALNKRISLDGGDSWLVIVGVVGDVKEFGLDQPAAPEVFYPQTEGPNPTTLIVRTASDPSAVADAIVRAVHEIAPQTAVSHVLTLEHARAESVASPRVTAGLLSLFAGLALFIAGAGIGGTMALTVTQRTKEIGVRLALGAPPGNILRMVLKQAMALAGLGVVLGLLWGLALTRLIKSLLFQVKPGDPATFFAVAAVLLITAAIASYLPARRAAEVDPLSAVRSE
ncbi:MAG TPA: ABC transporter permease [Candidatus Angelobacter sp.]|nr:ABC transporter permease [Candidatus Angelobacter sp.]